MLEILFPCEGELVNDAFSSSTDKPSITIFGKTSEKVDSVFCSGNEYTVSDDGYFTIPLGLTSRFMEVSVSDGKETIHRRFVYDSDSTRRYNFFIDDNVFFLTDLVRGNAKSIFDSFYLAFLKKLHENYNFKVTLNTFFRNDHAPFTVDELDERYKNEFEDNSSWLRLAFHSYSEFPDAPYSKAFPEKYPEHHKIVTDAIRRYAGEKTLIEPVITHFYDIASDSSRHYASEHGMNIYTRSDRFWKDFRMTHNRESDPLAIYDYDFKQLLIRLEFMCNLFPAETLLEKLEKVYSDPTRRFLNIGTHEQYFYKSYSNYLPDHFERVESVVRSLAENNYECVFFTGNL